MDGEPSKKSNGFRRIKLKVQEARKRDLRRSKIRLDSATMKDLDVTPGDIIEIQGKEQSTAAIAWPAYPPDQGLGIIRIDSRVRKNANVGLDEFVNILKVDEAIAKSVVLAPISLKIKLNTRFESFVKRKLLNFPITKGDLIYIKIGMAKKIVFRIISIKPAGISLVKQSTILSINKSTILL